MQSSSGTRDLLQADKYRQTWMDFFRAHRDALFQTALLLSADPDTAEAGMASAIDVVDMSEAPEKADWAILQDIVARQTIQSVNRVAPRQIAKARSMLQSGLWPVLQLEQSPRVCLVLRMLLRYATSSCAQMLGIEEVGVRTLLRLAILQLQRAVVEEDCVMTSIEAPLATEAVRTVPEAF